MRPSRRRALRSGAGRVPARDVRKQPPGDRQRPGGERLSEEARIANLYVEADTLVGTLDYGSVRVAVATMGYKYIAMNLERAREEICVPTFMVRILPNYLSRRGEGPRICELVRTQIDTITVKGAWTSPARLQLFEHVDAPLADLPVREIVSASHIITDLVLPVSEMVHDYRG